MVYTAIGQCEFPDYENYGQFCSEARFLCGYEMDGFVGELMDENAPLPQPIGFCAGSGGQADNIQWFSFIAEDSILEIVIHYSDCIATYNGFAPGLQVGIYENCELNNSNEPLGSVYCVQDYNYIDIVLTPDPADIVAGQLYLLFVDGYANSACDFEIEVITGICTDAPDTTLVCEPDCGVINDSPIDHGCTMTQSTFSFMPSSTLLGGSCGSDPDLSTVMLDSIICVEWNIQPDTGFIFISSSFEYYDSIGVLPTLIVEWILPGEYTIEPIIHFNPLYSSCGTGCDCPDDLLFTIEIIESDTIYLPEIELCPGECVDFCGVNYCDTGSYGCYYQDLCLLEIQSIVAKTNIDIDEGLFFLCPGECYDFQDIMYCDANNYVVSDSAACDTTYLFQLEELSISIDLVQADDLINCDILAAFLEGDWNTNFIGNINSAWISESGDTVSFGKEYTATDGGDYTFVVWAENMKACEISRTHTVVKDDAAPNASLFSPLLNCNNPLDNIVINTQDDILSVNWIGPNGFVSNNINPEVVEAGMYEVEITTTNGCQVTLMTEVIGDFENPIVTAIYDDLKCLDVNPVATYVSPSPSSIVSHEWRLPDGSTSLVETLTLNSAGIYSVEVTASNGCTAEAVFDVLDLAYDPSLHLSEDRIWRCMDTPFELDLSAQEVQGLRYTWTNLESAVLSNTINLTISSPGVYILTIEDDDVFCVGHDTVRIIEDPIPFIDAEFSVLPPLCEDGIDGSIDIMNLDGGTGPYTYEIDGAEYSDIDDIEFVAGMYAVNIIDAFGCIVSKDIEVPTTEAFVVTTEPELSIRFGQSKTVTFETSLDESEISVIEWTDDEGEILGIDRELEFTGREIDFLNLRVENIDGCEVTTQMKIDLSFDVDIYYPNVFSPDGDGNNDLFILYNNGFPEMADDLKIFDRAGELIYKSSTTEFNETKVGWDGTFNGKPCQPGVYVFILQYTLMNGTTKAISGSITLIR